MPLMPFAVKKAKSATGRYNTPRNIVHGIQTNLSRHHFKTEPATKRNKDNLRKLWSKCETIVLEEQELVEGMGVGYIPKPARWFYMDDTLIPGIHAEPSPVSDGDVTKSLAGLRILDFNGKGIILKNGTKHQIVAPSL